MKDLEFIGIGGAYALELGGNCAFLKEGNTLLIIDCCEDATIKLKNKNAFNNIDNILVAITHTHSDHVAGLGTFIWYCNFLLNIKPKIVSNSKKFEIYLKELLRLLGVEEKFFEFVEPSKIIINDCSIEMQKTTHTPILECFGIMFSDSEGKYYYTGDTNDFENVRKLVNDFNVKKIYCETSWKSYSVHIEYEKLKQIKHDKLVLMHFEDEKLYNLAKTEGFNVAKI